MYRLLGSRIRRPSGPSFAVSWALALVAAACASGPAQWTFQPTPEATPTPAVTGSPAATGSPTPTGSPTATATSVTTASPSTTGCPADATVVRIEETASLTMAPASVDLVAGKKACFEVTNTAGFTHNFNVGPTSDIDARNQSDAVAGIPDFSSGTQMVEFTPTGSGPFAYACWIAAHLEAGMKGSINLAP